MHHLVFKILGQLHPHPSHGAYLSSYSSFTGNHSCPVCDCPLTTGLLASFFIFIFSVCHPSIQQALSTSARLVHLRGPRAKPLNECKGRGALLLRTPPGSTCFHSTCILPVAVFTPLSPLLLPPPTLAGGRGHRCVPAESQSSDPNSLPCSTPVRAPQTLIERQSE